MEKMSLRYLFKKCPFNYSRDKLSFDISKLSKDEQTRLTHLFFRVEGIKYTKKRGTRRG